MTITLCLLLHQVRANRVSAHKNNSESVYARKRVLQCGHYALGVEGCGRASRFHLSQAFAKVFCFEDE